MDPVIEELVGRRALAAEQATGASVEFSQRTLWQRLRGASPWRVVDRYGSPVGIYGTCDLRELRNNLDYCEITDQGEVWVHVNW